MTRVLRLTSRAAIVTLALLTATACRSGAGIGDILGGVLGGQGQQQTVSGTILGVDTYARQIGLQTANGQQVALTYDTDTRVVYQDQYYSVTALERGDQVTARVQTSRNNAYYTDLVQVDRSVSTSTGVSREIVSLTGTVQQLDRTSGWFLVRTANGGTVTVSLPYNVSRADEDRFRALRVGENVRVYVVPISNTRAELRQFY